jgi:hypothetical protein
MSKSKKMSKKHNPPQPNSIPAPTGLTATMTTNGVYLQWYAVPLATTYWLSRSDREALGEKAIAIIPATTFTDHYPVAGTTYKVAAVVNSTLGNFSNPVTVN